MKKILTMLVVISLLASPALAYAGPDDPEKPKVAKIDFDAAVKEAAAEIVFDRNAPITKAAAPQSDVAKGKLWTSVAVVALGAGLIYKGTDLYDSESDPFGRKKNADAYLAIGVGSVMAVLGVLGIRGGLAGRGFNE